MLLGYKRVVPTYILLHRLDSASVVTGYDIIGFQGAHSLRYWQDPLQGASFRFKFQGPVTKVQL